MRAKRKCELCSNNATIYCGSDEASLCCECDSKVHGANFLVAKHIRTLLCRVCQSPTPWTSSGPKLGPTISVCQTCLSANRELNNVVDDDGDDNSDDDDDDDDDGYDDDGNGNHDDGDGEDEDDEDNQVVPWSYSVSHPR